jgi:hypothetical protein
MIESDTDGAVFPDPSKKDNVFSLKVSDSERVYFLSALTALDRDNWMM